MYDILSGPSVDPEPQNWAKPFGERVRSNRFASQYWDHRLCELLTEGEFDPNKPYKSLAIPVRDLVRYWWNNLADQEAIIANALEGILTVYKDRMLPEEPEKEAVGFSDAFQSIYNKF